VPRVSKEKPSLPCTPNRVNHHEFFNECSVPAYHFVVLDYGHVDFLDDKTRGVRGKSTYYICKKGVVQEHMCRFCGGIMVSFLNSYLRNNSRDFSDLNVHPHRP